MIGIITTNDAFVPSEVLSCILKNISSYFNSLVLQIVLQIGFFFQTHIFIYSIILQ